MLYWEAIKIAWKQQNIAHLAGAFIQLLTFKPLDKFLYFVCLTGEVQPSLFIGVTWKDTRIYTFFDQYKMNYSVSSRIVNLWSSLESE